MNITLLFEYQSEMNKQIYINPNLNQYKISTRKNLELTIKLGALADETNCSQYKIENSSTNICYDTVLKKYLDCLGGILSLGIERDYSDTTDVKLLPNDYCLSDQFLSLYIDINDLIISPSKDHFLTLLEDFLSLGITLGYSENQIINNFINL